MFLRILLKIRRSKSICKANPPQKKSAAPNQHTICKTYFNFFFFCTSTKTGYASKMNAQFVYVKWLFVSPRDARKIEIHVVSSLHLHLNTQNERHEYIFFGERGEKNLSPGNFFSIFFYILHRIYQIHLFFPLFSLLVVAIVIVVASFFFATRWSCNSII